MRVASKLLLVGTALLVALGLGACGERDQVTVYKQGKYQGKPDTPAWDNDPLPGGGKWKKGDRASWETEIKERQLSQNEYKRIYQ